MERKEHPWLSPKNFGPASAYLVLLAVLGALVVELNKEHQWIGLEWLTAILVAVAIAGGLGLMRRLRASWRQGREHVRLDISDRVTPAAGLIAYVSLGPGRSSALQAAQYHGQALRHLWLVTTKAAEKDALWVKGELNACAPGVKVHEIEFLEDRYDIRQAKERIESLRRRAMAEFGIAERELICDFTGLTMHASAGMILACAPKDARLQYMAARVLTEDGRADPAAGSSPREVDIRYVVLEDEE